MAKKMKYDFLDCIRNMPPLVHSVNGEEFDIANSEAAEWIANQPDVLQKVFDLARYHRVIKYNSETGKWQGVDFDGN